MLICFLVTDSPVKEIKHFATDIVKGSLAVFLSDIGITRGEKLKDLLANGKLTTSFGFVMPIVIGSTLAFLIRWPWL